MLILARLGASHHLTVRQIERLIDAVSNQFKHDTSSQIVGQRIKHYQEIKSKIDPSTVSKEVTTKFEKDWKEIDRRLGMLAGKDFISQLSARLQKRKGFSITTNMLIDTLPKEEIPSELTKIIMELDAFCTKDASKSGG